MAKKKKIRDELRQALLQLDKILDEGDPSKYPYPLTERQVELLLNFIGQIVNPSSHRPVENYYRDTSITADVAALLQRGFKRQEAYKAVAGELLDEGKDFDYAHVGKIYRKYRFDPFARTLASIIHLMSQEK